MHVLGAHDQCHVRAACTESTRGQAWSLKIPRASRRAPTRLQNHLCTIECSVLVGCHMTCLHSTCVAPLRLATVVYVPFAYRARATAPVPYLHLVSNGVANLALPVRRGKSHAVWYRTATQALHSDSSNSHARMLCAVLRVLVGCWCSFKPRAAWRCGGWAPLPAWLCGLSRHRTVGPRPSAWCSSEGPTAWKSSLPYRCAPRRSTCGRRWLPAWQLHTYGSDVMMGRALAQWLASPLKSHVPWCSTQDQATTMYVTDCLPPYSLLL